MESIDGEFWKYSSTNPFAFSTKSTDLRRKVSYRIHRMILKTDSWDIWHMPRQRELTVHNHANRLKNKCTFLTPSHGFIFNPQRRKIYNNNTLLYKTYKLSNWKKPLHGMVALCARMPTPIHSSPMLQVNYPFSSPLASTSSFTSLDLPPWSYIPSDTLTCYRQKTTLAQQNSFLSETVTQLSHLTHK